jgi:glycosyltransferase involved in cell wall biosynthesis
VLDDPDLASDLRAKGLARARQFSWAETARRVLEVVERVVGA